MMKDYDNYFDKHRPSCKGYSDLTMSDALVILGVVGAVGGLAYGACKLFSSDSE